MTIRDCETAGTRPRAGRSAWVRPTLPSLGAQGHDFAPVPVARGWPPVTLPPGAWRAGSGVANRRATGMLLGLAVIALAFAVGVGVASSTSLPVGVALLTAPALVVFGFLVVQGPKWCLLGLIAAVVFGYSHDSVTLGSVDLRVPDLFLVALAGWVVVLRARNGQRGWIPGRRLLALWLAALGILALPAARARNSRYGRARRLAPPRGDVRARLVRPLRALPAARRRVPPRRDRSHHHDRDLPGGRQCRRGGARRSATLWRERPQRHRLAGRDRGRVGAPWSRTGPTATEAVHVRDGGRGPSDEPIARFDRCGRRRARYLRRADRERTSRRRAKPRSRRSDSVDSDARRRPRGGHGAATSEPTNVLGVRREHNDGPRGVCRRWSRSLQGTPSVRGRLATRACGDRFSYGDRRAPEALRR